MQIDATVTDDGLPTGELTVTWEQIDAGRDITLEQVNPKDPTLMRLTLTATGDYEVQVTADDTDLTTTDTVSIFVRETPCLAAQAMPDYEPMAGDFNADCIIDVEDLAEFAAQWLACNSLLCP